MDSALQTMLTNLNAEVAKAAEQVKSLDQMINNVELLKPDIKKFDLPPLIYGDTQRDITEQQKNNAEIIKILDPLYNKCIDDTKIKKINANFEQYKEFGQSLQSEWQKILDKDYNVVDHLPDHNFSANPGYKIRAVLIQMSRFDTTKYDDPPTGNFYSKQALQKKVDDYFKDKDKKPPVRDSFDVFVKKVFGLTMTQYEWLTVNQTAYVALCYEDYVESGVINNDWVIPDPAALQNIYQGEEYANRCLQQLNKTNDRPRSNVEGEIIPPTPDQSRVLKLRQNVKPRLKEGGMKDYVTIDYSIASWSWFFPQLVPPKADLRVHLFEYQNMYYKATKPIEALKLIQTLKNVDKEVTETTHAQLTEFIKNFTDIQDDILKTIESGIDTDTKRVEYLALKESEIANQVEKLPEYEKMIVIMHRKGLLPQYGYLLSVSEAGEAYKDMSEPRQFAIADRCIDDTRYTEDNTFLLLMDYQAKTYSTHYLIAWYVLSTKSAFLPTAFVIPDKLALKELKVRFYPEKGDYDLTIDVGCPLRTYVYLPCWKLGAQYSYWSTLLPNVASVWYMRPTCTDASSMKLTRPWTTDLVQTEMSMSMFKPSRPVDILPKDFEVAAAWGPGLPKGKKKTLQYFPIKPADIDVIQQNPITPVLLRSLGLMRSQS